MNIGLVNFIDFLAILFDVGILTLYFHIFFRWQSQSKMKTIAIYIVAIIIYYWSSTCLSLAYQRTLIYLVVCLMISTCYKGSTSFKLLLTTLYVGIGVILETTVSFLIAIFAENVSLVDVGTLEEYILGLVLSSSIFFCIVCCIWFVFQKFFSKVDLSKSLGESYWNLLFFVLIDHYSIISYGIYY